MHRYRIFRYRLFDVDGEDVGEIKLVEPPQAGDDVFADMGRKLRVVTVVPTTDPNSLFNGFLTVKPAPPAELADFA